mmetsp:Transcript_3873/g.9084  ORF Transcript_3873/g.9084 Transcript_3873/m.9084 type:complete len:301 (-) Transcript_3873:294-1196(-)
MVLEVVLDECGDEEVAVVITLLHPQSQGDALLLASLQEGLGPELMLVFLLLVLTLEAVRSALIDQETDGWALVLLEELDSVVLGPLLLVLPEVKGEGLLAPGGLGGVADRGEGGDRAVLAWVLQSNAHGSVAAHAVSEDTGLGNVRRQHLFDDRWELLGHVVEHVVVLLVLLRLGVEVEACALAEVVLLGVLIGHLVTTGGGVRHHQHEAQGVGKLEGASLFGEVSVRARKAGEPVHDWELFVGSPFRDEGGKEHRAAAQGLAGVFDALQKASGDLNSLLHGRGLGGKGVLELVEAHPLV